MQGNANRSLHVRHVGSPTNATVLPKQPARANNEHTLREKCLFTCASLLWFHISNIIIVTEIVKPNRANDMIKRVSGLLNSKNSLLIKTQALWLSLGHWPFGHLRQSRESVNLTKLIELFNKHICLLWKFVAISNIFILRVHPVSPSNGMNMAQHWNHLRLFQKDWYMFDFLPFLCVLTSTVFLLRICCCFRSICCMRFLSCDISLVWKVLS